MAKVFIRTNDLTDDQPIVIAAYKDETVISDDAHGPGMTVMSVPDQLIGGPHPKSSGMPALVDRWRERAGDIPVKAEAKRRIEKAFSISDQLNMLHELVDAILKHGTDVNKWPADVRQRKTAHDEGRKYIAEVRTKVRSHAAAMPRDPGSDKIWPQRLKQKF